MEKTCLYSETREAAYKRFKSKFVPTQMFKKLKQTKSILHGLGQTVELCWILGHAWVPGNEIADKKAKESSRRQEEMMTCSYLFSYFTEAIHGKWNAEWNEKKNWLKDTKPETRPLKENNRCRFHENVINRLRASHTLLTHWYLIEGLPVPDCELCRTHAMTVKHLITDCANLVSLRFRCFDGANPNKLKQFILRNKVNSNTI